MKKVSIIALVIVFAFSVVGYAGQVQVPMLRSQQGNASGTENLSFIVMKNVGTISQTIIYEFFELDGDPLDVSSATGNFAFNNYGAGTLDLTNAENGKVYLENVPANGTAYILPYKTNNVLTCYSMRITVEQYNANDNGVVKSVGYAFLLWALLDGNSVKYTSSGWTYQFNGGLEF